jgi:hypothetical protein
MIGRIALASVFAVTLTAAVLPVTVSSYRSALDAHSLASDSIVERSNSHAAETYLAREREAMNQYLLGPRRSVLTEIGKHDEGFRDSISRVGVGEALETLYVRRAIAANFEFLASFSSSSRTAISGVQALRSMETRLDARENRVLAPLRTLRSLNTVYAHKGRDPPPPRRGSRSSSISASTWEATCTPTVRDSARYSTT